MGLVLKGGIFLESACDRAVPEGTLPSGILRRSELPSAVVSLIRLADLILIRLVTLDHLIKALNLIPNLSQLNMLVGSILSRCSVIHLL